MPQRATIQQGGTLGATVREGGVRRDRRTRSARAEGTDARAALLGAAAEVFARRGFRGASVEEIAERAGYSKGAVYWHFDSKQLLDHEYWALAVRDPDLRGRYGARRGQLRAALGRALEVRLAHLGAPAPGIVAEEIATVLMSLSAGLSQERLIDPSAVPDELLGRTIVLLYRGLLAGADGTPTPPTDR
jgi:AcrR family transcriptional regulator